MTAPRRLLPVLAAVAGLGSLVGCTATVPGTAQANQQVMTQIKACDDAITAAVGAGKQFLFDVELRRPEATPDLEPFRQFGAACRDNVNPSWSEFITRVHAEYQPMTPVGLVGKRQFMLLACRGLNISQVDVSRLSDSAKEACSAP